MQCRLLIDCLKRSINNVFLFTVGFSKQAFHTVTIVRAFENPFADAKHSLCGKFTWHFRHSVEEDNSGRFQRLALLVERFNEFAPRQAFILTECISNTGS